jgi:hypothetical protein
MSCETCSRARRGWFGGCLTATAVIELFVLLVVALVGIRRYAVLSVWDFVFAILIDVPVILLLVCVLSGIPSAAVIWLSERFCIRSLLYFSFAGGLVGAVSQTVLFRSFDGLSWLFVLAGCFAGLSYWYIAGRYAGQKRRRIER